MEEKIKSNILIYIIVIISLIIIILICGGVTLYKKIMSNNSETIQNEENNFYNYFNNQQENVSDAEEYDGRIKKQIILNGESLEIEVNYINTDIIDTGEIEENDIKLYSQEYIVKIDNNKIEGIENGSKYINAEKQFEGELFSITKVKDKVTSFEYLVLKMNEDLIAAGPRINVYIIDYKEGKIITKLVDDKNSSALFLKEQMEQDENGDYISDEEAQLKMEILDDEIISYEYNLNSEKVEKKIYTIENGILKSKIDKVYETSEIWVVGKSW